MAKIPKNLADKDMLKGYKEKDSFESLFLAAEEDVTAAPKRKTAEKENLELAYLTPDLQVKLGKFLLDLKMDLYKDGVVDYEIKVKRDGRNILLMPVEHKEKPKR